MNELRLSGNVSLQAEVQDGKPFAVLKPMCEALGLRYKTVEETLKNQRWAVVRKIRTTGADGKKYQMTCVDERTMVYWLARVEPADCHPEVRAALHVYQDEAADALHRWVNGNTTVSPLPDLAVTVNEMQKTVTKLVSAFGDQQRQITALQHQSEQQGPRILEYLERIEDQTKGKRNSICDKHKRRYRAVVFENYSGKCPCCQRAVLMDAPGKVIPGTSHLDHFHHRSMNELEHCWLVCKHCNNELRDRKPGGFWFQATPAFHQFQRILNSDGQLELNL